ncbi:MAG TPA: lysylphosphatidylglycerol synthase transmembrane domain-containing protein [Levilinea sp.]|nr:lysylphosphatidylglycerol synthase transmembrane domain-containing protein [Levilinea sp.]
MRKFFIALVLLLAFIFLITRYTEVQGIIDILRTGAWYYIGLAVGVVLLWLLNVSASYQAIYRIVGIQESKLRLLLLAATAQFVNTVMPAVAGASAAAVFLNDGRKRGHSAGRVMAAWALFLVFDYAGLLFVVMLGIVILHQRDILHWGELVAFGIVVLIACTILLQLILAMKAPHLLGRVLATGARWLNRAGHLIGRKDIIDANRAYSFASELSDGMTKMRGQPRQLLLPLLLALTNKALLIVVLLLIFLAFNIPFSAGTLIAGFGIAYLFVIVSPTPSGLGIVEPVMTLILRSLRVPLEAATVITLAFRGLTFWLPWLLGMIAFRGIAMLDRKTVGQNFKEELN